MDPAAAAAAALASVDEERVMMLALRDFNMPKLVEQDQSVFARMLGDLFPALRSSVSQPRKAGDFHHPSEFLILSSVFGFSTIVSLLHFHRL